MTKKTSLLFQRFDRGMRFVILVWGIIFMVATAEAASARIDTYPLPACYTNSSDYTLTANGTNIPAVSYTAQHDYAEFSMSTGAVTIQVTAPTQTSITNYNISPKKLGLTGTVNTNTLTVAINESQNLIISINGLKPLVICADPTETNLPPASGTGIFNVTNAPYNASNSGLTLASPAIQSALNAAGNYGRTNGTPGILYIPAGVYLCGNLVIPGNTAVYLQGGAVLRGTGNPANFTSGGYRGSLDGITTNGTRFLAATNAANIKIYGRGTIDANGYGMGLTYLYGDNLFIPANCTNVTVDGITFRDSGGWGIVPTSCTNITLSHLKIFDNLAASQDDCIDVVDSQNVTISDVIGISGDDTLSTKSYSAPITNVLFANCLLWSQAVACKIGWSVATPQSGITYSNIVVYNCQNGIGLAEYTGGTTGGSSVQNLTFDTLDIENTTGGTGHKQAWAFFSIQVTNGTATNVLVKNINVRQSGLNGSLGGIYTNTLINGITFSGIYMPGSSAPAANLFQMELFNQQFYTNLTILPVQTPASAVYLVASDASGSSSFKLAGNWSDNQAPNAATNYVNAGFILRTPTSGNATFAGLSLTLYDSATLALKNDNAVTTLGTNAATGLFLNYSTVKNVDLANDTLAGFVTLLPDGGIFEMPAGTTNTNTFTITAVISGPGALQAGSGGNEGTLLLTGTNSYAGGTFFGADFSNSLTLRLSGSGTLGATNGSLTFNSTNDLLDLNGTAQNIGTLAGPAGTILNSAAATTSTLTCGNGDNGDGLFSGSILNGNGIIALTKVGTRTLTLAGTNHYTGATSINAGTLALGSGGSISDSTNLIIAAGASLDVSAIPAYVFGAANTLTVASGIIPSCIRGTASGTIDLGSAPLTLNYDGVHPALTISAGTLSLSQNAFSINGPVLASGVYTLIQQTGGSITSSGGFTVSGSVLGTNTGSISIRSTNVMLTVGTPPPSLAEIIRSGTNWVLIGTNGQVGATYILLASTNLALPFANWTPVATNTFSGTNFSLTNAMIPSAPQTFFHLHFP